MRLQRRQALGQRKSRSDQNARKAPGSNRRVAARASDSLRPLLVVIWMGILLAGSASLLAFNDASEDVVRKGPFSRKLLFTGELRAANSIVVTVPELRKVRNFTISYLAPEGDSVQPGDVLVRFDTAELEISQLDLENELEEARINMSRTEADLETESSELELARAVAESDLEIAELYAGIDPQLIPRAEQEEHVFNASKARYALQQASERLVALQVSARAEMEVARLEYEQADLELKRILTDIQRMTIRAPAPGLVVYEDSWELGRKYQIGDSVRRRGRILRLPNLDRMLVLAIVHTADFPYLFPGMQARITLDAYPDREFTGRLERLPEVARPLTRQSQLRIFLVEFLVAESVSAPMKTGMTAQVEVDLPPQESLIVARRCIRVDKMGRSYVVPADNSADRIYVDVVDANAQEVAVEGNLSVGLPLKTDSLTVEQRNQDNIEWIPVRRQDLTFTVLGTGFARPAQGVDIGPPAVPGYTRFKLIDMVEEGIHVEPGDFLMAFDPSDLERRVRSERSNRARLAQEYERQKANRELQIRRTETQLEESRVNREKAVNRLSQAREFESGIKVREAKIKADLAKKTVVLLERKLESLRRSAELRLKVLEERRKFYSARIGTYQQALRRFRITSPVSGIVVYRRNYNNEAKEIGNSVYSTDTVLAVPDLSTLGVAGNVAEVDAGKIVLGQEVLVRFDALPEVSYSGRVAHISNIFKRASYDRPLAVLEIGVELDEIDLFRMRPGMTARLQIVEGRVSDALTVPLASVQVEDGATFLWVEEEGRPVRKKVRLGRDNGVFAVVKDGLEESDQVSAKPL